MGKCVASHMFIRYFWLWFLLRHSVRTEMSQCCSHSPYFYSVCHLSAGSTWLYWSAIPLPRRGLIFLRVSSHRETKTDGKLWRDILSHWRRLISPTHSSFIGNKCHPDCRLLQVFLLASQAPRCGCSLQLHCHCHCSMLKQMQWFVDSGIISHGVRRSTITVRWQINSNCSYFE